MSHTVVRGNSPEDVAAQMERMGLRKDATGQPRYAGILRNDTDDPDFDSKKTYVVTGLILPSPDGAGFQATLITSEGAKPA